jgi:hypothetical protein
LSTLAKIREFGKLPQGWHYGRGVPPTQAVIDRAAEIVLRSMVAGLEDTDAFIGTDGEIQITAYHKNIYLEFTVEPGDVIRFVREEGDQETQRVDGLCPADAFSILKNYELETWRSSGSYTATTTTRKRDGFRTSPSRIPAMVPAYRWLTATAQMELV